MNKWNEIREFYKTNMQDIMSAHPQQYGVDPYWWEDIVEMTPIERSAWSDIRSCGVVFYPQFPVLGYFADFANPKFKIIIECDGKDWHDPEKDASRDAKLNALGWTVHRFTGSQCKKIGRDAETEDGKPIYIRNDLESLLSEIRSNI